MFSPLFPLYTLDFPFAGEVCNLAFSSLNTQSSENCILCTISVSKVRYYIMKPYLLFLEDQDERK